MNLLGERLRLQAFDRVEHLINSPWLSIGLGLKQLGQQRLWPRQRGGVKG
jgi:hypothetical protein